MKFRSRPVVFAIATALGAGIAVPGALALTSTNSTQAPTTTKTTPTSVEEQHEAQAAEQHEAANSELGGANADQKAATKDTTTDDSTATDGTVHADDQEKDGQNDNTKAPGTTGDEHRSDVAAHHSQADMHRAVAPGVPADKAGDHTAATKPSTTADQHHGSHGDDVTESGTHD